MFRGLMALALASTTVAGFAADAIYREVGPDGTVRYTDRPADKKARPIALPPLSGTTPGTAPAGKRRTFYTPEALRAAARFAVSVESPTPGQVFRGADARPVAAANVMPGLIAGFSLVYVVDGRSIFEQPVQELSVLFPPLDPGEHSVSVIVLDDRGREAARSGEIAFRVAPE